MIQAEQKLRTAASWFPRAARSHKRSANEATETLGIRQFMALRKLGFEINTAESLEVTDPELSELLTQVYVAGGCTPPGEAARSGDETLQAVIA